MGKEQANQDNEKSAILFTEEVAKLSYYQRCRKLFVQYWYVLFPCHGATGLIWFGSLFLVAQSGVIDHHDLVKLLETLYFPEIIVKPLRNPNLGNLAVAYALFKLVAPARYLLTLAITVPLIKELVRRGLIKRVIKK
ncbi:Uncharacterized protein HDE_11738 [Halotydeus destructor]|nr:Uncharacterized protein HDE_11738 [Halotydeus destructor]